jgi:DNA-binding MarR family transcriptional regulator
VITSEDQAMAMADAVRAVSRATVAATRATQGLPPLPEAQVAALHTLRASSSMTPAELAERLGLARPTVSNLLRDLEAAGHVTRARSEVDRRSVILTITEQARDVQDAFHRGRGEVVTSAWAALDESDRAALAAATPSLRRLADLLQASTPPTSGNELNR